MHEWPPTTLSHLLDQLSRLEDPRQSAKVLYPLPEILLLALAASLAGADDMVEVARWAKLHPDFLRRYYPYANGFPSHDALSDVFNALDAQLFSELFIRWVNSLSTGAADLLNIDGKTSRRSGSKDQKPLHLVSAWANQQNLVLGQEATDQKSNEITAIPALLHKLAIEGCLITIDAMGTQKNIAKQIVDAGGDYLLAVKDNQKTLAEDIELFFQQPPASAELDEDIPVKKDHGRLETRRCRISNDSAWLQQQHPWAGLASILCVESWIEKDGKTTYACRHYICSLAMSAKAGLYAVRSHWGVENKLHWVLDVLMREDLARNRSANGPHNLAILRHMGTNLLRSDKSNKHSLKVRRKQAGWSTDYLAQVLEQVVSI